MLRTRWPEPGMAQAPEVSSSPSLVFDRGIRRAAIGLFAVGSAQVFFSLPLTAPRYATWWSDLLRPALLVTSLAASLANIGGPVRGANAVVPLVQLGAFAAGLAPGRFT